MSESENNDAILSGLAALRRAGVRMVPVEVMKLEELYSENVRLREALLYYAQDYDYKTPSIIWDGGGIARAALVVKP